MNLRRRERRLSPDVAIEQLTGIRRVWYKRPAHCIEIVLGSEGASVLIVDLNGDAEPTSHIRNRPHCQVTPLVRFAPVGERQWH